MSTALDTTLEPPKTVPPAPRAGGRFGAGVTRQSTVRLPQTVVVIGNGMAGFKFCESLRGQDFGGRYRVVVFGEEPRPAYDRVHLTQYFAGRTPEALLLAPPQWYADNGVDLRLGDPVVAVDRARRIVRSRSGEELAYDRLVFATGSRAWLPPIKGRDLPGVFVYRTLEDLEAIKAYAAHSSRAAVLGGGLLGLEAARALHDLGLKTWVVERGTGLLARQLDPAGSALLQEQIEALGISVLLQCETAIIEAAGDDRVLYFTTNQMLRVNLVVAAVGIRPRDELAADCGLELGTHGGIRVNDFLQTSDPEVYAVGECAAHKGTVYGLAGPSFQMAHTLAANLCGVRKRFRGATLSTHLKLPGIEVATLGDFQADGETVVRQEAGSYRRLVLEKGRLVGAVGVGPWPDAVRVREAVDRRCRVWLWQRERFRRTGRLWKEETPLPVSQWPADAVVCNCVGVSRGRLAAARAEGCHTVEQLARHTGASTVCGSCRPLLGELVGSTEVIAPARGVKWLLGAALFTLLLVAVIGVTGPLPFADTAQGGWKIDVLWRDSIWKQVTGFSLLGVSLISLGLSLRKRIKRFALGDFGWWRAGHAGLGMLTLLLLITHTGLRLGHNLNFVLTLNFLLLALAGALAGAVTALERRLSGPAGRQLRAVWTGAHLALAWPLPVLVLFHALAAYYF